MKELHALGEFKAHLKQHQNLVQTVLQNIDLDGMENQLETIPVDGAVFLGCNLTAEMAFSISKRSGFVFPNLPELPFKPYRAFLYSAEELFAGFDPAHPCSYCDTPDNLIYRHWQNHGRANPNGILEGILRRIHDQSISDALEELLVAENRPNVAIMGGHAMLRTDAAYRDLAVISRALTRDGHLMVSGGGPGAMEATHLGAWFAERPDSAMDQALAMLADAPHYRDEFWLARAFEVRDRWPRQADQGISLGIPTWLYGHEPPNPFASHIAKYFNNSLREDGLVTVAHDGIIFSPGSAGTLQEIFQDACQNHYTTTGYASPMVFLDKKFWTETQPIFPLLQKLAEGHAYHGQLGLCDTPEEVLSFLKNCEPHKAEKRGWSFCDAFCPSKNE